MQRAWKFKRAFVRAWPKHECVCEYVNRCECVSVCVIAGHS